MNPYNFYLILMVINIGLLSFAMYYTFARLEARGAKSLFLFLFGMLAFSTFFFMSLIVRDPQAKENVMIPAFGVIMVLPILWENIVHEFIYGNTDRTLRINIPFGIVNAIFFSMYFYDFPQLGGMMEYHSCQLNGLMYNCRVDNSIFYMISLAVVLFEFLFGVAFMLHRFFTKPDATERNRYLFVTVANTVGTVLMALSGTVFNDVTGPFDPLPFVLTIWTALMVYSVFSRRLLNVNFGSQAFHTVDDLLLVIDNDHYIQDVNMSTLNIFGVEVQDVISTQLEHAFREFPNLINLFTTTTVAAQAIELEIDGEMHAFEPTVTVVLDPETSLPSGQRLQLHDVTGHSLLENATGSVTVMRDPLTNQYTKDSFFQFGQKLLVNTRLREQPTAVVVIDIDDLNMINERFSHLVGDQGLIQLVEIINGMIRATDLLARFREDEMVLMLPNADEYETYQISSRIMARIADHRFSFQGQEFQMTVSMGYTVSERSDEHDLAAITDTAYQALEQSHTLGRNRLTYIPVGIEES